MLTPLVAALHVDRQLTARGGRIKLKRKRISRRVVINCAKRKNPQNSKTQI
jgi:hypothetical protein